MIAVPPEIKARLEEETGISSDLIDTDVEADTNTDVGMMDDGDSDLVS
jgi:hypothetical protein